MYNVTVTLNKTETALPTGVIFGHTNLTVTDAQGVVQSFSLGGSPWTQVVTSLADGTSTYVAQDVDLGGLAIGSAVSTTFTPAVTTFPATSGISVAIAP